jgi:D-threo-aldose 1-dehydrogenase
MPPGKLEAPMPTPDLFPHERSARRIGFGCGTLMRSASAQHRQRLLAEAFEQGIRHFDVARMYGLGAAERELGQFARSRREEIVIATKFGIEPAGPAGRLARLQAPARAVVSRLPALREAIKRRSSAFHQAHRYDPASARASLQTSLRELGTDYVDILFIHDPSPNDTVDIAELKGVLEEMRQAGYIRAWGLAGEPDPCIGLSRTAGATSVLQVRDDILEEVLSQIDPGEPVITFGILSRALKQILSYILASDERRLRWSTAIGIDCARPDVISSLLLQDALERNPLGTVLFSTTRPERVGIATAAVETLERDPSRGELRAFRELVAAELTSGAVRSG